MRIPIKHFTGGEIGPQMGDRTRHACRHLENFIPQIYGNVERRPGTKLMYVSTLPYDHQAIFVGEYPTLRATTNQADPGLTHTTAISNFAELQAMENDLAGNYYLTGDIDASGETFDKIGTNVNGGRFTGTFDGCGYTISDLKIDTTRSYVGLFGCVAAPAKIANVTLEDCNVTGDDVTGSLIGMIRVSETGSVLVQNCHASGYVNRDDGGGSYNYGGLIGQAYCGTADRTIEIYDCSSSCTVTQTSTDPGNQNVGGFVGAITSNCTISNCYATGDVNTNYCGNEAAGFVGAIAVATEGQSGSITYCYATGNVYGENNAGGFCGRRNEGTTISKCYATGNVIGETSSADNGTGGFIGENSGGEINNCYAWGDATDNGDGGDDCAGGFIGLESSGGGSIVTNCYSIGTATATTLVGGFVGHNAPNITACFWDNEASGNATSDAGVGHMTLWMKTKPNYTGAGWDFDTIWYMPWEEV